MAVMTTTIKKAETLSVRDLLADPDLTHDDLKLLFDLSERVKATPGKVCARVTRQATGDDL